MKDETKIQRKWKKIFLGLFIFFLTISLILGTVVFLNWDYILFKAFITNRYLKTDILDEIYPEYIGQEINGRYFRYFDNLSIAAVTKLIRDTGDDYYTYQYNPDQFESYTSSREEKAALSYTEELTPDTIYMLLTNFTPDSLDFFIRSIPVISEYKNLVLDLRDNGGGDIDVIFKIADYFLPENAGIVTEYRRHRSTEILAKGIQELSFEKIVILQNNRTASASEQLIAALGYNLAEVTTVGTPTFGKSVGQTRIALLEGFYVKATTLEWKIPDGTEIDGNGIEPDVTYEGSDIIGYVLENLL
ncbi:MAG TPA: S41 family peptidase [Clostridia bacterium]|nr:S41 family peptidase [Clostridia bacterium]HPQ45758.1 S41 family peptidase [Clostridia bacterium]